MDLREQITTIKGIGEKYILGNHVDANFTGVNYLKEVHINGYPQNDIAYKYYLDQECMTLVWMEGIYNMNEEIEKRVDNVNSKIK